MKIDNLNIKTHNKSISNLFGSIKLNLQLLYQSSHLQLSTISFNNLLHKKDHCKTENREIGKKW